MSDHSSIAITRSFKRQILLTTCLCAIGLSTQAVANTEVDELLLMDLEALMNVEVSVASKRDEKIADAPGIINVITQEDIRRYGANDLHDLFRRLPGVIAMGSQSIDRSRVVSIRAQHTSSIDKHLLILIDGRPWRQGYVAGLDMDVFWRAFPLSTVQHIEVIRGPGSVLYGTNAVEGVINIITKKGKGELAQEVSVTGGSFRTAITEYAVGGKSDDLAYFAGGRYNDVNGADKTFLGPTGGAVDNEFSYHAGSGLVNAQYGGFTFSAFSFYGNEEDPLQPLAVNHIRQRRDFVDTGYEYDIDGNWKSNFNVTFNNYDYNANDRTSLAQTWNVLGEASISGSPFEGAKLLLGGTLNNYQGERKSAPTLKYNDTHRGLYGQFDYQLTDAIKLVAGMQANSIDKDQYDLSPRAGIIANFNENWGTKLLYSEAFRAPTQLELLLNLPIFPIIGNPALQPETVKTVDWQIFYNAKDYFAALTFFHTTQENTITYVPTTSPTYFNLGTEKFEGFELEGKARINENWNIQGSISHQVNERGNVTKDIHNTPNFMAKIGVDYENKERGITVGVFDSYFGDPADVRDQFPALPLLNPEAEGYHHLTANVEFNVNKFIEDDSLPPMTFSIFGDNLLENDFVFFPPISVSSSVPHTAPQFPGRSVYGKFTIKF